MHHISLRRPVQATVTVALALLASSWASGAGQSEAVSSDAGQADALRHYGTGGPQVYSVITLGGDETWDGYLNRRGQVATSGASRNRFFDGRRLHEIGSLGGGYTLVSGVNDLGVVIGQSEDAAEHSNILAFTWTVGGGMRALPGMSVAFANAINDHNQIAGSVGAPGIAGRAVRWEADRRLTSLGPLPFSLSEARAINNHGETGGFADFPGGAIHAIKWTARGTAVDLGTLPGMNMAGVDFLNERGDAAGLSGDQVFFWSAAEGMVATGAHGNEGLGQVVALSDRGEVVGNTQVPTGGTAAYVWSHQHGLAFLPPGQTSRTFVWGNNGRGELVGSVERTPGASRAVRWKGLAAPVDLTSRLYHPPAGLILHAAIAINDEGDIVAYSNAGLVLLRPGTHGTDAPVLGPVTGAPATVNIGDELNLSMSFVDNSRTQSHKVAIRWDDDCGSADPHPWLQEANGAGVIRFRHRVCRPGQAGAWIKITDSAGNSTEVLKQVYVNEAAATTLSGKGTLAYTRPAGASQPLRFALWVPVASQSSGPAQGAPQVQLSGPFQFHGEQLTAASRSGQSVHLEGSGRLNGQPGYRFMIDADASGQGQLGNGRLHVQLAHTNASGAEVVDYDNLAQAKGTPAMTAAVANATAAPAGAPVLNGWLNLSN